MILLVLSMHSADVYSPFGNWYFVDRQPLSRAEVLTFAAWQMYLQCFFMGLLFFAAGYFAPASLDRKGPARFMRDRAIRLGLPTLLYMFLIGPVTEYYFAHSWNSTEPTTFATEWLKHIRNGQFRQENGPLWFCLALLIFCGVYAALPKMRGGVSPPVPGTTELIGFALIMAGSTFLARALNAPVVLNMHLRDFPQYILLFGAGIAAARGEWLGKLRYRMGIRWLAIVGTLGFAAWLALLLFGGALAGKGAYYSGGWHWQNAAFSLWESFTCIAFCFALLVIFRERFPAQGRISRFLSENAFSVYVFHPPILIAAARMLSGVVWLSLVKFAALSVLSAVGSFGLSALIFRRIPGLRRIL